MDETTAEVEKVKSADELAEEAAEKTVGDTKKQLGDNGANAEAAYAKLIESVSSTHKELEVSDPSGKAAKAYDQNVLKGLEKEGLMPKFALEYGSRVVREKNVDINQDSRITREELQAFKKTGKLGDIGNAMVDQLVSDSGSIRGPKSHPALPGFTISDLNATREARQSAGIAEQQRAQVAKAADEAQKEAKSLQSFLFDTRSGASLFEKADFDGSGGDLSKKDNRVNKSDFEALMKDPNITKDQRDAIQDRILNKWDDPSFRQRFINRDGYMTPDVFKFATGELAAERTKRIQDEAVSKAKVESERKTVISSEATGINKLLSTKVDGSVDGANVFNSADYAGSGKENERKDGLVSKKDLQALLLSPGFDKTLANQIQEQIINKMDNADFKARYMSRNGEYLDQAKIDIAMGKTTPADIEKATAAKVNNETRRIAEVVRVNQITEDRSASSALAARLVAKDSKGSTMLEKVDFAGSGKFAERTDGLVNDKDLASFMAAPGLEKQDRDFIKDELLAKWETAPVKLLRDKNGYISLNSLKSLLPNS